MTRAVVNYSAGRLAILWVITALCIGMLPQLLSMPAHLVALTVLPVGWRLLAEFRHWRPAPLVLRIAVTAVTMTILVSTYGGLLGRRTAVSMLVLMLALKLLETFRIRDARIVASLSLFLCATQFLFSQGIPMVIYIVACLLSSLIALMYLQRWEAFGHRPGGAEGGHHLFAELGFSLRLLALAVPVGLALFLLFPRWGSPLWGVPEDALDARSGLSDSMSPGSIQSLFMDDSPAFRAQFDSALPSHSELYWRGPVFWNFDGLSWQSGYLARSLPAATRPEPQAAPFRYEVQMEPTEQRWLFALDYPALVPQGTFLTMDYQLISRRPVTQLKSYAMASDPGFTDSPELKQTLLRAALDLPPGFNPKTAEMMAGWREEAGSDSEVIRRVLAYFRREPFHYTLNPPLLSQHTVDEFLFETRRGFCEHYASAFTVMMRMAGIPARVVTGYQGGWYNDLGAYVLVRQSDAHAWSEVWVKGAGWTRIDPTAAVAPDRVEEGSLGSLDQRRHLLDFAWLRRARNTFDLFQRGWNNWVVAFGSDRQSRLFSMFGLEEMGPARLVIAMLTAILVMGAVTFLCVPLALRLRSLQKQDPLVKSWRAFLGKLRKAGFAARPSMGPVEVAAGASRQLGDAGDQIKRIADLYALCRYAKGTGSQAELAGLVSKWKAGRPG